MRSFYKIGVPVLALSTMPMTAAAEQLTWASGWPPGSPIAESLERATEMVASETNMTAKHFPLSLLNFNEMVGGVRDGIVDIGYVFTPYFPAELSDTNLAADLSMLATTGTETDVPGLVMSGALLEYVMLDCVDCREEFTAQNMVYLAGGASSEFATVCDRPVESAEDMQGLKIRVGQPNFGRLVEELGAVKVAISGNEIYEALASNSIDCTMIALPELISLRILEVVEAVTLGAPGGVFAGVSSATMGRDVWSSLTIEQREAFFKIGAQLTADIAVGYVQNEARATEEAKAAGVEFMEAAPELVAATEDFVERDIETISEQYAESYGVSDVEAKIERMTALIEKWKGLTEGYGDDVDAFAQLLQDEVYSNVDPETYGLN